MTAATLAISGLFAWLVEEFIFNSASLHLLHIVERLVYG